MAAFILSLADHDFAPGESLQSLAGEASGDAPMPASRRDAAVRLRLSFCVGVEGPPYIEAEGLIGFVLGRARKKRCETCCSSSTVASTAAAPAQKAKERAEGRVSKELAELVVVPMTWRRVKLTSER